MKSQIPDLTPGTVALVGAGPGDPDLLTCAALRLMQQATDVVYDRLVSDEIMALAPDHVQRHYAGKRAHCHALTQSQTNALLLKLAREGRRVLRLKGGDPFVFGRGGEEQAWLHQHGVECFVVPGITSAFGCSALNGLPLTHRDAAQMVTLATGHLQNGELRLDWQALATGNQTVVFYMGLANAAIIREKLIAHGRAPGTPVALIERGATPQQRRCITTLNQLPDSILSHGFQPPTLIIVGDVVRHAAHADAWLPAFESLQEAVSCG